MLPYFSCALVTLNWFCTKRAALFFKALIQRLLFFVLNQFEVIRWNIIYFINADADNGAGVKAEGRQRGETLKIVAEVAEFISTAGCWHPHLSIGGENEADCEVMKFLSLLSKMVCMSFCLSNLVFHSTTR